MAYFKRLVAILMSTLGLKVKAQQARVKWKTQSLLVPRLVLSKKLLSLMDGGSKYKTIQ